jgi:hypothetical protein
MVAVAFTRIEWEAYPSEALNHSRMLDTKDGRKFKLRNLRPLSLINHFRLKYKLPCSFTNRTTDRFGPGSIVQRRISQSVRRQAVRCGGSPYQSSYCLMSPVRAWRRLFEALAEVEITSFVFWAVPLFRRTLLAPFSGLKWNLRRRLSSEHRQSPERRRRKARQTRRPQINLETVFFVAWAMNFLKLKWVKNQQNAYAKWTIYLEY